MSYIEIDFDASRRGAALIKAQAERLGSLLGEAASGDSAAAGISPEQLRALAAFSGTLKTLSADLLRETEALAAIDDRMKQLHHITYDGRSISHGEK
jgi:hypothetical protein